VAVLNLSGTAYLDPLDNPFTIVEQLLEEIETPNIFVDFHGEATAEKKAMGYFLAGKVTAVVGTHTHVQTADETILSGHTGYLTDVGMTGPEESILGVSVKPALDRFRFHFPTRFTEADTPCFCNGVVVGFDEKCGKCTKIQRLIVR
jgi:calcineurin-like phosphoesterase